MTEEEILYDIASYIKQMIRRAIAEEREACAQLAAAYDSCQECRTHLEIAARIRGRQ